MGEDAETQVEAVEHDVHQHAVGDNQKSDQRQIKGHFRDASMSLSRRDRGLPRTCESGLVHMRVGPLTDKTYHARDAGSEQHYAEREQCGQGAEYLLGRHGRHPFGGAQDALYQPWLTRQHDAEKACI
jgi:hypothetical protein